MRLNSETLLKWAIAIVIIFGIIGVFFRLQLVTPLFIVLILSCVILVFMILLQAGKGGGLAAIGGLADQSAFGTKTGTVLSKITYLVGAAFIVATVCLTKIYTTRLAISVPPPVTETAEHAHDFAPVEPEKPTLPSEEEAGPIGMQPVQEPGESTTPTDTGQEAPETTK